MSQLLNGRNKKVSDELLRKLHNEFPQLNVSWLLFGEGDMLTTQKNETSEPQTASLFEFPENESTDIADGSQILDLNFNDIDKPAEKTDTFESADLSTENALTPPDPQKKGDGHATISFSTDGDKKIVNIIVYYNDNSFESFIPGMRK